MIGNLWLRFGAAVAIVAAASVVRAVFFAQLGRGIAYLTYYPAVMLVAIVGGFWAGLSATLMSALLCYYWIQQGTMSTVEWMAMSVFCCSCTMISAMAGAMHQARRRALEAKEVAEAASRAKSVFLANMSHELRTPLNAILGFSDVLQKADNVTPKQREFSGIIHRSGEHLLNLINNVLDISKIEAGRVTLEPGETDLHQVFRELQSMMSVRVADKGLEFRVEQGPDLPRRIRIDGSKLRQVLINLVGNAVKFTTNGMVTLRAAVITNDSGQAARNAVSGSANDAPRLRFEVTDTGPGIAADDVARLFVPFVQVGDRPPAERGTGLGLAISKEYVVLLGGTIGVTSAPGRGSTFHFEIPLLAVEAPTTDTVPAERRVVGLAAGQPICRVLIAEDQRENMLLLRTVLDPLAIEIREAVNGREAVAVCEEWHPHLIWMDIRMPVMDGLAATRCIRAMPMGAKTKIVALTAHALEEERNEILAAGCDDLIRKPYREAEIFDAMARHLGLEFVYASPDPRRTSDDVEIAPAQLAALDAETRRALQQAVVELDVARTQELIRQIGNDHPALGDALGKLAQNLSFDRLLNLLENTGSPQENDSSEDHHHV